MQCTSVSISLFVSISLNGVYFLKCIETLSFHWNRKYYWILASHFADPTCFQTPIKKKKKKNLKDTSMKHASFFFFIIIILVFIWHVIYSISFSLKKKKSPDLITEIYLLRKNIRNSFSLTTASQDCVFLFFFSCRVEPGYTRPDRGRCQ